MAERLSFQEDSEDEKRTRMLRRMAKWSVFLAIPMAIGIPAERLLDDREASLTPDSVTAIAEDNRAILDDIGRIIGPDGTFNREIQDPTNSSETHTFTLSSRQEGDKFVIDYLHTHYRLTSPTKPEDGMRGNPTSFTLVYPASTLPPSTPATEGVKALLATGQPPIEVKYKRERWVYGKSIEPFTRVKEDDELEFVQTPGEPLKVKAGRRGAFNTNSKISEDTANIIQKVVDELNHAVPPA